MDDTDTRLHEDPEDRPAAGAALASQLVPNPGLDTQAVIDALLAGNVITVSSVGKIADWNRHAQLAFGLGERDAIGRDFAEALVAAAERDAVHDRLEELLGGSLTSLRARRLEIRAQHGSGRELRTDLVILPVTLDESENISALLAQLDADDGGRLHVIRERHREMLDRLRRALDQEHVPMAENRLAGLVVVFAVDTGTASGTETETETEPSEGQAQARSEAVVVTDAQVEPEPMTPMRAALAEDRFVLCGQPVLHLASNAIVQHEVLIRMTAEDGTLLLPGAFLPAAEQEGLMPEIDAWVARKAILLIADQERVGRKLRLEINLGAATLHSASFGLALEAELAAQGIDPSRLVLEVSEHVAAQHVEETAALSRRARALGCRFAIDNFGATFACLRHLKHISVDYLKVDGSLVAGITESRADRLMLDAIVGIARGLGAATVAEWVSDVETLTLLREASVDLAQGYRIGRPLPMAGTGPEPDPGYRD